MKRERNDVFVGNIAFGTSEEDLERIFSEVGRVASVRMATHAETGRSKGYCFVEYEDAATAISAIRNLNNREVNGRHLRVNFSNNSTLAEYAQAMGESQPTHKEKTAQSVVDSMSRREVWQVVKDSKELAESNRAALRAALEQNPALVDALIHALSLLGMVVESPPEEPARPLPPRPFPPQQQQFAPQQQPQFAPQQQPQFAPQQQAYPMPPQYPPRGGYAQPPPRPGYNARPPPGGVGGGFYPAAQQVMPPPELIQEALALSPQQLALLPPDRRAKIEMLRDKFGRGAPPPPGGFGMPPSMGPPPQGPPPGGHSNRGVDLL